MSGGGRIRVKIRVVAVLALLFLFLLPHAEATVFSSSVKTCKEQCVEGNIAFPLEREEFSWPEHYLTHCDYQCRINACQTGCADLDEAASTCHSRCSTIESGVDSCKQGCHAVEQAFVAQVQDLINSVDIAIDTEVVLLDEEKPPEINLHFSFPDYVSAVLQEVASSDIEWFSQHRATNNNPGWKWTALPAKAFRNTSQAHTVSVALESSPQISVRIAAGWRGRVIVSRPVVWTLPTHSLLPMIKMDSQLQLAADKYAICWKTNREKGRFRIVLSTLDGNPLQTINTTSTCHLLRDLPRENCCRATIADITDDKETPPAETTVKIDLIDVTEPAPSPPQLILTNGTHIVQLENANDYIVSKDPMLVPFELTEDDKITAIVGVSSNHLIVGTERGGIWWIPIPEAKNETEEETTVREKREDSVKVLREPDGSSITHIVHDPLQRSVYALLSKKGLLRCSLDGAPCTFLDSASPIQYIAVDSWNGFVYYVSSEGDLVQAELFSFNATESYNFERKKSLPELSPAVAMEIDYKQQELIVVLQNGSVVGRDIVNGTVTLRRDGSYSGVKKMHLSNGRMFWTKLKCGETPLDEVCFYSEEKDDETIHFSRYLYSGLLVDFTFISDAPLPPSLLSPVHSGLVTSDTQARVTWLPPTPMPYQAVGSRWRNTIYECRLQASDSDSAMHEKTNQTDLFFNIVPKAEYTASVRACTLTVCSPFANSINTAFSQMNGTPIYIMKRSGDVVSTLDILGQPLPSDPALDNVKVDKDIIVTLDNSTETVYTAQPASQVSVSRSLGGAPPTPFLTYLGVTYMTLMPSKALIVVASAYQVVSYRLTGSMEQMIYSCSQSELAGCAEVVGLAGDDSSGQLFFVLQTTNGTVQVHTVTSEQRTPTLIASSADFPPIQQLVVANNEKLLFITRRGHMGFVDKQLGSLNINHALTDVDLMLPIRARLTSNKIEFSPDVAMGEKNKNELTWSALSSHKESGSTIFKVILYKDRLGSDDRFQSVSLTSSYTLPSSLLESWASGQHFDVAIQAVNAWTSTNITKTGLIAPTKPPTQPMNLRIYATQQKTVDGARAIITFFWESPAEWNGDSFRYVVSCTQLDAAIVSIELPHTVTHHSFAVKNGKVTCAVAASNEPNNIGDFSPAISIDSSELRPLVRLFAIDSTNDLIAIPNITDGNVPKENGRKRKKRQLNGSNMEYQAIAYIENDLYAIVKEADTVQPTLVQLDTNNISNVLHKVSIGGEVSRIEAMTTDWVGFRLLFVMGKSLYQITLDPFLSSSILTPKKLIDLSLGASDAKQLTFDPFTNTAYLLTRNGSLFSLNLWKGHEENLALTVPCLSSQTVTWMTTEFAWNRAASPKIYALTWNGLVEVELGGTCGELKSIDWNKFGEKGLKAMSAFSIADKLFVFVTSSEMLIYRPDGSITPIPIKNPPVRQILAVSQSSQPYPERSCFSLPSSAKINFSVQNEGRTGASIFVDRPPAPSACAGISLPQTLYDIYFNRTDKSRVKHIESYSDAFHVENGTLDKEADYEVRVSWHNRYFSDNEQSIAKSFRTGFGYPSSPKNPHAFTITPDTIFLLWNLPDTLNAPINQIKFRISQQVSSISTPSSIAVQSWSGNGFSPSTTDIAICSENPCRVKIANLRPSTDYKFWVTAIHESHLNSQFPEDSEAVSSEAVARTKDIAGTLRPDNVSGSSILLRWNSLQPEEPPTSVSIQYKESGGYGEWKTPKNASFEPKDVKSSIAILITSLLSATSYDYRFVAVYRGAFEMDSRTYDFSEDYYQGIQQARTKAGTPTEPQSVSVRQDTEGWIVEWLPPNSDGGSPITSYAVEMRLNHTAEWEIAERGLDGRILFWRPPKADAAPYWQFRVRAANQEGFGPYKEVPIYKEERQAEEESSSLLPIILSVVGLILVVGIVAVCIIVRRHQLSKPKVHKDDRCITLEQMSQFPESGAGLNAQIVNELKNLPRISRENIIRNEVLGKGSFGKVYEGTALLQGHDKPKKVAIKVLRDGYNEKERIKFMREAILMNNFDHPNIVRLLGVCFDHNDHMLVIELMEGGDLLSFLRDSRPKESIPSSLSLKELLSMMIDIGRGGAYLEQHRHVHRDLSARNCLISDRNSPMRVTKIADFGLARDVFSNDYYQVHGEDFLPLRWLAPESAAHGIFSTQSDVWSFGIVLYEILSLGHQPYPGKQNPQVLQLLKSGGHPDKPPYCPEHMLKLLKMCWQNEPTNRPSFSALLEELEALRGVSDYQDDKPFPPTSLGHVNHAFNVSLDSSSSGHDPEPTMSSRIIDPQRFDKSSSSFNNAPTRKLSRPTTVKAQRKEKGLSIPGSAGDSPARSHLASFSTSSISNDTPGYDNGAYGRSYSSGLRTALSSNSPRSTNQLQAHGNDGCNVENDVLSRSWSGPNRGAVSMDPNAGHQMTAPSRSFAARPSTSQAGTSSAHGSSDNLRTRSRVSQV